MNSDLTLSVVQSINQYLVGSVVGTVCDEFFDKIEVQEDQFLLLMLKSIGQIAMNGILIKASLDFLHGNPPSPGYRDPTGGYMYLFGLYDSQPKFRSLNKKLFTGMRTYLNYRMERTMNTNGDDGVVMANNATTKPGNLGEKELGVM